MSACKNKPYSELKDQFQLLAPIIWGRRRESDQNQRVSYFFCHASLYLFGNWNRSHEK